MGTLKEWREVVFFAAWWPVGMLLWFYGLSILPRNKRFKSTRKQTVLLRFHPLAVILWSLMGAEVGLFATFWSRVWHGELLIVLAMVTAGMIATIFVSNFLAHPKSN
jgi:hypothetical protein